MITTRWARQSDAAVLSAVDRAAGSSSSGFPSYHAEERPFFSDDSGPAEVLVGELDGEVVGYAKLKPWYPMPENAHVLGLQGVAVHPDAQGCGVGTALLRAAETIARERGVRKLRLGVFGSNPRAQALYAREGWVVEGVLRGEWLIDGVEVDDVQMSRFL